MTEVLFLEVDLRVVGQRRYCRPSVGEALFDAFGRVVLPAGVGAALLSSSPALTALVVGLLMHVWVIPRARRCALARLGDSDLGEVREALQTLNRLDGWVCLATAVTVAVTIDTVYVPAGTASMIPVAGLGVRPQTLQPAQLTSTQRDGVVDHFRLGTDHTKTHRVITIRQPMTLHIPIEDSDLADIVMVLLHCGTDAAGKPYLDQRTIGEAFRLSRQMTNVRIALYRARSRIEDVLARSRENNALTTEVVDAIHRMLLEDPFVGSTAIRERLVADGVIASTDDISLATISRAMQAVDYLAVRAKIQELLGKGELAPDARNLIQRLLREMKEWAPVVGKKAGQALIPLQRVMALPGQLEEADAVEDGAHPERLPVPRLPVSENPGVGASPDQRWSFLLYFTCGAPHREIAAFLGVSASTIYRRLVALRKRLPPLQTFLGRILFSGAVAIDEKYVLAPKPHREGKMGRWVYLFLAIDPWSYDLLHADVYPTRTADCARAFLLELKAKGVVKPRVIVTDLWGPYETVVPEIYPGATHHLCVFHAEQATTTLMRDKLGTDYASVPAARELKSAIIHLFRAGSRRTLIRRYQKLLDQRPRLVESRPELASVFESLTKHFAKVANAYSSHHISVPKTNNAVESVIRTFTRRYKTMAGFDSLETARAYVQLWSYYYRFRPFSPDASPRIRNRSPLQIAGYEVEGLNCLDLVMPPPQVE